MYTYESASQLEAVFNHEAEGFTYSRDGHPNAASLADKLNWMEHATAGIVTASGMTAISAAMFALLEKGDCVAAASQLYGRSLLMIDRDLPRLGFETRKFDASDPATFETAIIPGTRIVLVEIISNPMLRVTHFQALVAAARKVGALVLVDNTFTTPRLFNPLKHGADLVMQSVTKMLSGHSDLNLGYLGARDPGLMDQVEETVKTMGFNASPYNCWMAERGLNTFDLRFERAQENALRVARYFEGHPMVSKVHYPGLPSHPDFDLVKELLPGAGSILSFVLNGARTEADRFLESLKSIPYGPTLGDVATMVIMPSVSSHRKLSRDARLTLGIEDNLIRVSVGIEAYDIIEGDFADALQHVSSSLSQSR
jgi:cystathionine gamma-synthase